jgi:APA family basic amino acid/polyamine antiporter
VALIAGFIDTSEAVELSNIGTLFAFVLVSFGIIVLRHKAPELERPFRVPFVPWLPLLGASFCVYLMASLPWIAWVRFFVWLGLGLTVYLSYGLRHSRLAKGRKLWDI